jgi:hypothetical protein
MTGSDDLHAGHSSGTGPDGHGGDAVEARHSGGQGRQHGPRGLACGHYRHRTRRQGYRVEGGTHKLRGVDGIDTGPEDRPQIRPEISSGRQ